MIGLLLSAVSTALQYENKAVLLQQCQLNPFGLSTGPMVRKSCPLDCMPQGEALLGHNFSPIHTDPATIFETACIVPMSESAAPITAMHRAKSCSSLPIFLQAADLNHHSSCVGVGRWDPSLGPHYSHPCGDIKHFFESCSRRSAPFGDLQEGHSRYADTDSKPKQRASQRCDIGKLRH